MKKYLSLLSLVVMVLSGSCSALGIGSADQEDLKAQLIEKNDTIAGLETEVQDLTGSLTSLQSDYETLQAELLAAQNESAKFMCENQIENMKYQNVLSAIAILEGWFAVQPQVKELQGTYSTQFWTGVNSRIHTIRYISAVNGQTETASFMIFFEEENWHEGLLYMSDQCWLDFPD